MTYPTEAKDNLPRKVEFSKVSDDRLLDMLRAAEKVSKWEYILAKTQDTPISELLRGVELLNYDDAYPADTVEDHESGCQYYFHAHSDRPQEYGHFHTYVMASAIPETIRSIKPATVGEHQNPAHTHCHLIGISVDGQGKPVELFTINHWSAHEAVYSKEDLALILDTFEIGHAVPSYPLNRWVSEILKLFRPQILEAFSLRETILGMIDSEGPEIPSHADETIEVTSRIEVSIDAQMNAIQVECLRRQLV